MHSTLQIWKQLQNEKSYFETHPLQDIYDFKTVVKPTWIKDIDIKDKVLVEIGSGYGRETASLSKLAKHIYTIEVSEIILVKMKTFISKYGNLNVITPVLYENYKTEIPDNIDTVYSRLVFQHLTKEQAIDYINTLYEKLVDNGVFYIQFLIGPEYKTKYIQGKEPMTIYPLETVLSLFSKFDITYDIINIQISTKAQFQHLILRGTKTK